MEKMPDDYCFKKFTNPTRYKLFFTRQIDDRIGDLGLSEGQIYFLFSLDREKGISLKELTEKVGVHKSLTTRMIKSLIENGFAVDKKESGKEYCVVLTDKGEKAKERCVDATKEIITTVMGSIPKDELESFFRILDKIHVKMEEMDSELQDIPDRCSCIR